MRNSEHRDKILPILQEKHSSDLVAKVETKLPSITILNVNNFTTKEEFVEQVKKQNPEIKRSIDSGSEFNIVFTTKPSEDSENRHVKVVVRVSPEIRSIIKANNNRIYIDLMSYRVVDRFYIKRCNNCQQFGHYKDSCTNEKCCGFCSSNEHVSLSCPIKNLDSKKFKCSNCKNAKKECSGHSTHWHNCPTYLEMQKKLKASIPFYSTKN